MRTKRNLGILALLFLAALSGCKKSSDDDGGNVELESEPLCQTMVWVTERDLLTQSASGSLNPSVSDDGRYVAFASQADNLIEADYNLSWDIFLYDRDEGTLELASVDINGRQILSPVSRWCALSGDGRHVVYYVTREAGFHNEFDIYVYDRVNKSSTLLLGAQPYPANEPRPVISSDGRYVCYNGYSDDVKPGDSGALPGIVRYDRETLTSTYLSRHKDGTLANNASHAPSISNDGRFVAYLSSASNLVDGDDNGDQDVFVHDCLSGNTTCVSLGLEGEFADARSGIGLNPVDISGNGRYIVFDSYADNLVENDENRYPDVFWHDRKENVTRRLSSSLVGADGPLFNVEPRVSRSGRFVAYMAFDFAEDEGTLGRIRLVVHDVESGTTRDTTEGCPEAHWSRGSSLNHDVTDKGRLTFLWNDTGQLNEVSDQEVYLELQ